MELIVETSVFDDEQLGADVQEAQQTASTALDIAGNNEQYFWHTESGTDTGVHITLTPQDSFKANPAGYNLLARNNGVEIRDGMTAVAVFANDGTHYNAKINNVLTEIGAYTTTYAQIGSSTTGRYNVYVDATSTAANNGVFIRNGTIKRAKYSDNIIFYDSTGTYALSTIDNTGMTLRSNSNNKIAEFITQAGSGVTNGVLKFYDGSANNNVVFEVNNNGGTPYLILGKQSGQLQYVKIKQEATSDGLSGIVVCQSGIGEMGAWTVNGTDGMSIIGSGNNNSQGELFLGGSRSALISRIHNSGKSQLTLYPDAGYNATSYTRLYTTNTNGSINAYFGLSNGNAYISGLLNIDVTNIFKTSIVDGMFAETTVVIAASADIPAGGGSNNITQKSTLAGYYPLCISGWNGKNRYCMLSDCELSARTTGTATVNAFITNVNNNGAISKDNAEVNVHILWVKVF